MNSSKITIPLDIPNVTVVAVQQDELGEWHITVENQNKMTLCGVCGEEIECKHGHGRKLKFRHLPILGKATYIYIAPKRGKCIECANTPTTTQTVRWYQSHSPHTQAYDKYLVCQLKGSTVVDVSAMEQIGYDAILGTLKRQMAVDIKWDEIEELGTIGIDEVSTKKGKKAYRAVLTARQANGQKHILAVLPDRKKNGQSIS